MAICDMCGQGWCGRPCIHDPHKSNALLFHANGKLKTLKERGLSWDDPPPKMLVVPLRKAKLVAVPKLKEVIKTVGASAGTKTGRTKTPHGTETPSGTKTKRGGRPKKDKALTAAERKQRWLAKRKTKPLDFKG